MIADSKRAHVTVITVQYGNLDDTAALAESLGRLEGASSIELIVVDNAPTESGRTRSVSIADTLPFPVRWLVPGTNLYYWGGAAFALDSIRAGGTPVQWVIICNNDITIPEPGFLSCLLALDPLTHAIVAPNILSVATGREQNPLLAEAPGALKRLKWRLYDLNYHVARALLRVHAAIGRAKAGATTKTGEARTASERTIYAAHGACVILSSAFFESGGSLDTTVPLFAEELTLAEEARRLNLPIRYVPALTIRHAEHSTTGPHLTRAKYAMERSARRHYYSLLGKTDTPR